MFKYLKGGAKRTKQGSFQRHPVPEQEAIGMKRYTRGSSLNTRKHFHIAWVMGHWYRLPRDYRISSEIFKNYPDMVLGTLLGLALLILGQVLDEMIFKGASHC